MKFSIETVSKMTGIPAPSLRNWEKRYGFPNPERTSGGHRFYSALDVEFLKKAVQWIEEGHSLGEISDRYKQQTQSGNGGPPVAGADEILDDVSYRVELIYEALLKFDQMATLQHYATLSAKLSVEQLFDRVFERILKRIGQDWSKGQISIAQEHFASSFVRLKLSTFLSLDFPPTQAPRVLTATTTDERHEGGLMLISAHLKFRGYPVFYFGSDLPADELKSLADHLKPDVICLSYNQISNFQRDLPILSALKTPVCLGGAVAAFANAEMQSSNSLYFCQKAWGSEAAQYVEMLCQSKAGR